MRQVTFSPTVAAGAEERFQFRSVAPYIPRSSSQLPVSVSTCKNHFEADVKPISIDPEWFRAVEQSLKRVDTWLQDHDYAAYDPFDGLSSFLRPLTLERKLLRQILLQGVKRTPFNLRPLVGIGRLRSTKGMGFLARGYLRWGILDRRRQKQAKTCLDWLQEHTTRGFSGACWGNAFDYQSRLFYLPAGQPTVVWSALIGHAFVDAFEAGMGRSYLATARSTSEFILRDLPRHRDDQGICISYIPADTVPVHNANALAAGLLSRVYRHTGEPELRHQAEKALAYTVGHQNPDGSWCYGVAMNLHWIDNWHTGYVLDSLLDHYQATGESRFMAAWRRGLAFYLENFFVSDGCPKYYPDSVYPVDIQCAAQSIETLCRFADVQPSCLPLAKDVALWTICHMQDKAGYFYYQRHRMLLNRTPCLHWGQATMLSALSLLLNRLSGEGQKA